MFTEEMEHERTTIHVIDDHYGADELVVELHEDCIFINQYTPELDHDEQIMITPAMFNELLKAMNLPTGTYTFRPE